MRESSNQTSSAVNLAGRSQPPRPAGHNSRSTVCKRAWVAEKGGRLSPIFRSAHLLFGGGFLLLWRLFGYFPSGLLLFLLQF